MTTARLVLALAATVLALARAARPVILTNHLGYGLSGPKRAVVQGQKDDEVRSCAVEDADGGARAPTGAPRYVGPAATSGLRETRFFFPQDTETAPCWQGENARLGSMAFAARLGIAHFAGDRAFVMRLGRSAQDQLNWILGLNPFDASRSISST